MTNAPRLLPGRAYLGIGANLGNRVVHLQGAVDRLAAAEDVHVVAVSPVYETTPVGGPEQPDYLNAVVAVDTTLKLWSELERDEAERGLDLTREPDLGFVWPMYRWARGEPLSQVLASGHGLDGDMPAGDFVRWARQVVDLLGQLAQGSAAVAGTARQAMAAVNRGVLAYNSVS